MSTINTKFEKGHKRGMTGKRHSVESRKKMRDAHLGIKKTPHTEETKEKMRKARKLYFKNGGYNPIINYNKEHTGEKHYWFGKKLPKEVREKMSEVAIQRFSIKENHPNYGKHCSEETKQKLRESNSGEKWWNWRGGKSFEPYTPDWTKTLKFAIRQRDNFTCQRCGITEEEHLEKFSRVLSVNHIDYDKTNCDPKNLNTLCASCNTTVNFNREYWTNYFNQKMQVLTT